MDNVLFLAGNIGLYPAKLELVDKDSILTQYKQVKYNFNQVIRCSSSNQSLIW